MNKTALAGAAFFLLLNQPCGALEIGDVKLPDSLPSGKEKLILNGAGYRHYDRFLKVYIGGLYLLKKSKDAHSIMGADEPMAIRLYITSNIITDKEMADATREAFTHTTEGKFADIEERVTKFISVFDDKIQEGDVYDLVYEPGKGVHIL